MVLSRPVSSRLVPGIWKESLASNLESKTCRGLPQDGAIFLSTHDQCDWDIKAFKLGCLLKSTSNKNSTCNENLFLLPSSCHCLKFVLTSLCISSVLCFVHVQTFLYLCCWTRDTCIAIKDPYDLVRNKHWSALKSPCNVFIQTTRKWYCRRYKEKESVRWHRPSRSR